MQSNLGSSSALEGAARLVVAVYPDLRAQLEQLWRDHVGILPPDTRLRDPESETAAMQAIGACLGWATMLGLTYQVVEWPNVPSGISAGSGGGSPTAPGADVDSHSEDGYDTESTDPDAWWDELETFGVWSLRRDGQRRQVVVVHNPDDVVLAHRPCVLQDAIYGVTYIDDLCHHAGDGVLEFRTRETTLCLAARGYDILERVASRAIRFLRGEVEISAAKLTDDGWLGMVPQKDGWTVLALGRCELARARGDSSPLVHDILSHALPPHLGGAPEPE